MDNKKIARPPTPTLDDSEVALNAPPPEVNKTVLTSLDLEPQQLTADNSIAEPVDADGEEAEDDVEGGDSDSDEDDVEITIGEINTGQGISRTPNYGRVGLVAGGAGSVSKKVDVDAIPQIGGQSLLEFDLEEAAAEKPWRLPGADIADYFNYGFTEDTWKLYCEKQRKMKGEVMQLNKIVVHSSARTPGAIAEVKSITSMAPIHLPPPNILPHGFPPIPPPPSFLQSLPGMNLGSVPPLEIKMESRETPEPKSPKDELEPSATPPPVDDNASDGRATPGVDAPSSSNKAPLLPPPNIPPGPGINNLPPPPFGLPPPPPGFPPFPPGQDNLAAAMAAAMFGGGIRPPDSLPPPHMLNNMPPFPLPPQGFGGAPDGMPPPPFPGMPPNFPMDPGLDDRNFSQDILSGRLLGQFPWDSSMGAPPQDLLEAFSHRNNRRGAQSRSPSTSGSRSRSSSYDDRHRRKRDRRHKRSSRSRSRSYERDRDRERDHRHRSSRHRNGEYHRSDRHDRGDRDRDRDRDSRRRREHREEKPSRHERSSRRHRSSSRGRDEERSSRKEKSSKMIDQEVSRDSSKSP